MITFPKGSKLACSFDAGDDTYHPTEARCTLSSTKVRDPLDGEFDGVHGFDGSIVAQFDGYELTLETTQDLRCEIVKIKNKENLRCVPLKSEIMNAKKWVIIGDDVYVPVRGFFENKGAAKEELLRLRWQEIASDLYERQDVVFSDALKERVKTELRDDADQRIVGRVETARNHIKSIEWEIARKEAELVTAREGTHPDLASPRNPFDLRGRWGKPSPQQLQDEITEKLTEAQQRLVQARVSLTQAERMRDIAQSGIDVLEWNGREWGIKEEFKAK